MASDDFNENDLADLDATTPTPSEDAGVNDAAIDAAYRKFFGNANSDEDKAVKAEPEAEVDAAVAARRTANNKRAAKEQQDELIEEGLDPEDSATELTDKPETTETTTEGKAPVVKPGETPETPTEEVPTLDPSLRLAANEMGWDDAKIDRLFKADPELAQETFETLAATFTNLSRQFLTPVGTPVAPGTQPAVTTPAQPGSPASNLDKFYSELSAFAETNGEEIVEKFLKPLKAEVLDPLRKMFAEVEVQRTETSKTEARSTFAGLQEKFADFYGASDKPATEPQKQNAAQLAFVADQLRAGASAQGRELSIKDALKRAHLIVSAEHRDQIVRKTIKEQVQRRAKTITAKPTQRTNPATPVGKSRAAAMDAYERKAADLGVEIDV